MLLVGAGLLLQSFWRLMRVDPGFRTEGLVTMQINLPPAKYPSERDAESFYRRLFDQLRPLPGVLSAATGSLLPFGDGNTANEVAIDGRPPETDGTSPSADWRLVSPGYFRTMGITLAQGRDFEDHDSTDPQGVAIVSSTMARRYWPGGDPIGRRVKPGGSRNWMTVVGIAGDVTQRGLDEPPAPMVYYCAYKANWNPMSLVVRTDADVSAIAAAVRGVVRSIDRELPVSNVSTVEDLRAASVAPQRFNMLMLVIFAAVALSLAAVGIYGVMAYSVTQRTHEIGIRMALGSRPRDVLRLIVGQAMRLTIAGIVLGSGAALALTRLMQSLLFGVSATDLATFLAVPALLAAVALAACYLPARRATKVDPTIALKYE